MCIHKMTEVYDREDNLIDEINICDARKLVTRGSGSFKKKEEKLVMILWVDKEVLSRLWSL